LLTAALASALAANLSFGQDAVKAEDQYVVLSYFKVDQENLAAFEEWSRTNSKKVFTEMMNQAGSNLWGWNVARILYRGPDDDAPTHVAASIYNGPPPGTLEPAALDALYKKITAMDPAEYRKRLNSLRELLGTELVRGIAWAGGSSPEGSYRVVTYSRLEPRRAAAHREAAASTWQPIYAAAAKEGKILAWSSWSYVFPRGMDAPYDILGATTYKDLPAAVRGYTNMQADFLKVHPTKSWVGAVDEFRGNVTNRKAVVSRIIASVSKNVTRQ
ncbi:MAG: hypothetical protein HXY18_12515, partial [Bryobacteraceae bacterium]|nr:hypothetical protein [Bryobacteraceae bacterium]